MTLSEFKAWFEGFTEDMEDRPTAKQWERVQTRVKQIDGAPVSYPVFIDRYWRYPAYTAPYYSTMGQAVSSGYAASQGLNDAAHNNAMTASLQAQAISMQNANGANYAASTGQQSASSNANFDSHAAMRALGKKEAA